MKLSELIAVNRQHRQRDDSDKWPVSGRFNVTERAIRQARQFRQEYGEISADEYTRLLDTLESSIVNDERNW